MNRNEIIFFCLALFFCLFGFTCVSLVSTSIAEYIGKNGWTTFNRIFIPILILLLLGAAVYIGSRFRIRLPAWHEWLFILLGGAASVWVISRTLLLTTELIHIPQFAICTLLFSAAFPRQAILAIGCSAAACIADEWVQALFPTRVLDLNDIFLNFIGLYIGLILWRAIDAKRAAQAKTDGV